ncbi:MAG TPA: 30S ribosomal protein S19e [Thermoplasmata archaeon]|nr:30S ribosomal protein S19e [Thermoplasmata archaeon]
MAHPTDIPAAVLLPRLAQELESRKAVQAPEWAAFARTGVHTENAPYQSGWWYLRSASVLRKLYLRGARGVARLASEYGGSRDRGSAPYHARSGSRSIAREILQQLEAAGLVRKQKNGGRALTPDGHRLLDQLAKELLKGLAAKDTRLAKYL